MSESKDAVRKVAKLQNWEINKTRHFLNRVQTLARVQTKPVVPSFRLIAKAIENIVNEQGECFEQDVVNRVVQLLPATREENLQNKLKSALLEKERLEANSQKQVQKEKDLQAKLAAKRIADEETQHRAVIVAEQRTKQAAKIEAEREANRIVELQQLVRHYQINGSGIRNDLRMHNLCIKCGSSNVSYLKYHYHKICKDCGARWYFNHCWKCHINKVDERDPETPECTVCGWYKCAKCGACSVESHSEIDVPTSAFDRLETDLNPF
jgi:hypothetical protein